MVASRLAKVQIHLKTCSRLQVRVDNIVKQHHLLWYFHYKFQLHMSRRFLTTRIHFSHHIIKLCISCVTQRSTVKQLSIIGLYNPFHTNAPSLSPANIRKHLLFMFSGGIEGNGDIKRVKRFCWLIKKESSISIRCDISGQNKKRECFFQKINYSKRQYFALTKLS